MLSAVSRRWLGGHQAWISHQCSRDFSHRNNKPRSGLPSAASGTAVATAEAAAEPSACSQSFLALSNCLKLFEIMHWYMSFMIIVNDCAAVRKVFAMLQSTVFGLHCLIYRIRFTRIGSQCLVYNVDYQYVSDAHTSAAVKTRSNMCQNTLHNLT